MLGRRGRGLFRRVVSVLSRVVAPAASVATVIRARLTRRRAGVVRLDDVRRRLELLITAVYDRPIPITTADAPKRKSWPTMAEMFAPAHLRAQRPLPMTDGERIQLPREIVAADTESALAEYRLMAIEQAERIARRTAALVPAGRQGLERDLYLLRESVAVDAAIARTVPGLRATLVSTRVRELSVRPSLTRLTARERAVEALVRESLAADLTSAAIGSSVASPDESLAWARDRMRELERVRGRYRGVAPVTTWGSVRVRPAGAAPIPQASELATFQGSKFGVGQVGHGSGTGGTQSSERGVEEGTSRFQREGEMVLNKDGPRRVVTARVGDTAEADTQGADEDESSDDDAATPDEPVHPTLENTREMRADAGPRRATRRVPAPKPVDAGIEYPEWDWEAGDYRSTGAIVRSHQPDLTTERWGATVLERHGALVRRLRERFERLRARRARLNQQRDGDELDLTACVRALVDQRTGHGVDDRLYIAVRPARRGLAITLLIDISGSTDEWIDSRRRVIDVEKVALLLASEALDALGDAYSILTFSGKGRSTVRMRTIKAFDETNGSLVRQRIGALEPEGYTRAGAAIRHAAALLERQSAAHRLLLIISDGKPNDVDGYEGLSGVEDTRQAINEARGAGVYPFCLTIDRQGQEYLGRIFGEAGHTVLRNPEQLPMALVKVVKHLLVS